MNIVGIAMRTRMARVDTKMNDQPTERYHTLAMAGIANYAAADASDPFTLQRCITHLRQGLCRSCEPSEMHWLCREGVKGKWTSGRIGADPGSAAGYNAQPVSEMRKGPNGDEYPVTVYRNQVRP
jgi:hypothetical protein